MNKFETSTETPRVSWNAITEVMGHTVNNVCMNYCSIEIFPSVGKGLG